MIIDKEAFLALSEMAKVPLAESDFDARLADFQKILAFVQQIESVSIPDDFEPQVYSVSAMAADIVVEGNMVERDLILENFPDRKEDYLVVPKVLNK